MSDQPNGEQLDYFGHVRSEIAPLLPSSAGSILEIGCSAGGTLRWLKTRYPNATLTGIDGFEGVLPRLTEVVDKAIIADLNAPLPNLGRYDLVLALDVLEHLLDPERVLRDLVDNHLAPGGAVIVSLPAVSHYSVSIPLLFGRKFPYADAGILDRTHLKLYVEDSAVGLMNSAGLVVKRGLLGGFHGRKPRLVNAATGGLIKHWLTKQYIMRGEPGAEPQGAVAWRVARQGT